MASTASMWSIEESGDTKALKNPGPLRKRDNVYEVEELRGKRHAAPGVIQYLVKWAGWSERDNTWEPPSNIFNKNLIRDYEAVKIWKWQFETKDGWKDMDPNNGKDVEGAYSAWMKSQKIDHCTFARTVPRRSTGVPSTFHYMVSFLPYLKQSNVTSGKQRYLRRVPDTSSINAC